MKRLDMRKRIILSHRGIQHQQHRIAAPSSSTFMMKRTICSRLFHFS